ncbi:DegT/DnrJ/EryC1/StrS family aminotransferase [Streptomyces sp. PRKS01-29]|nr:DegT/DnrJ/EryC1/StrS family aminotransferase [Streptomyces sabulosicollis]MBI0293484.1 DegT/DnrJ/EryC1/StrS family aminotransferase [Streptomyces sabulosicollis]
MSADKPAILGGTPILSEKVPVTRPTVAPRGPEFYQAVDRVFTSGFLTKGAELEGFEHEVAAFVGVRNAVAVSSGTMGLTLTLRCLGLLGHAVMPSFTFMATGHAARWNGLEPRFADIDPHTFAMTPRAADSVTTTETALVLAVHPFGAPCEVDELQNLCTSRGIPLILDAAAALGGCYPDGSRIGTKGLAEIFSLSPTKPLTCGEGGIIVTNDDDLAKELRIAREYGNPGNHNSVVIGLNGRMPELSAALGRHNLPLLPEWLAWRAEAAARYQDNLHDTEGIAFQRIPHTAKSTYKDLCVIIDRELFGLSRDVLAGALHQEGITTRRYFDPPLHRQAAYRQWTVAPGALPHTESVADGILSLPLLPDMAADLVDQICSVILRIREHSAEISHRAARGGADG